MTLEHEVHVVLYFETPDGVDTSDVGAAVEAQFEYGTVRECMFAAVDQLAARVDPESEAWGFGGYKLLDALPVQCLYDEVAARRGSAWAAQGVLERVDAVAVLADEDEPDASPLEAWWQAQGRAEAFAEVMTLLERHGARVSLVVTDAAS